MLDNEVKVKVLRGAILLGEVRVEKGHTFNTTRDFAEHLISQMPLNYEIIRPKIKEATNGDDIQPTAGKPTAV